VESLIPVAIQDHFLQCEGSLDFFQIVFSVLRSVPLPLAGAEKVLEGKSVDLANQSYCVEAVLKLVVERREQLKNEVVDRRVITTATFSPGRVSDRWRKPSTAKSLV